MVKAMVITVAIAILEVLQYYAVSVMVQLLHVGRKGRLLVRLRCDWLVGPGLRIGRSAHVLEIEGMPVSLEEVIACVPCSALVRPDVLDSEPLKFPTPPPPRTSVGLKLTCRLSTARSREEFSACLRMVLHIISQVDVREWENGRD